MARTKDNRKIPELVISNINNQTPFDSLSDLDTENYTCFGVCQKDKRMLFLKVVFGNGAMVLIQYSRLLSPITFNGSNEIKLNTPTLQLIITGSFLAPLMEYISEQRLTWVKSSSAESMTDSLMMRQGEPEITGFKLLNKAKKATPKP